MNSKRKEIVYDATPELAAPVRLLKDIYADFWNGRELAWRLFLRNLRGMYRQTLLGMFWIFLPPIANTAIWVFLRSRNVFDFGAAGAGGDAVAVDTTAYILTGMILWQTFVDALQMPLDTLNSHRGMVSKLNFPREALILQGLADLLFNLVIRLILLFPVFWYFEIALQPAMLLAIPLILLMVLHAVGMGLILVPIGSLYHDVPRFISVAIPFWMIITPIIYVLPNEFPGTLLNWLNPASPLLTSARDFLLMGGTEHIAATWVFSLAALPLFLLGLIIFRIAIPALVERMAN